MLENIVAGLFLLGFFAISAWGLIVSERVENPYIKSRASKEETKTRADKKKGK